MRNPKLKESTNNKTANNLRKNSQSENITLYLVALLYVSMYYFATNRWVADVGSRLGQRRRRWPSVKPTSGQRRAVCMRSSASAFSAIIRYRPVPGPGGRGIVRAAGHAPGRRDTTRRITVVPTSRSGQSRGHAALCFLLLGSPFGLGSQRAQSVNGEDRAQTLTGDSWQAEGEGVGQMMSQAERQLFFLSMSRICLFKSL